MLIAASRICPIHYSSFCNLTVTFILLLSFGLIAQEAPICAEIIVDVFGYVAHLVVDDEGAALIIVCQGSELLINSQRV